MTKALEGIKVVEIGAAVAVPIAGMLMGSWGAEVVHVESPGRGDMQRYAGHSLSAWTQYIEINYLWEHADRNKKSICVNLASPEGQEIIHRLCAEADVFLNNLRPYEMGKFNLSYEAVSKRNPKLIYANLTGYGLKGPEKNAGGYDSVAFWARSGVMEMMHDSDTAPNISRAAYGDSISSLGLLAGVMTALFARERTGIGQQVEVSLYNTAVWVLGFDITGCLVTGKDAMRPQRKTMSNPIRNHYPTKDNRWIMLGMTNAQTYWPEFCRAIKRPELEKDPKYADFDARQENAAELVRLIEDIFLTKTYAEWMEILGKHKLVWSPVCTPLEVTRDEQAIANEFFGELELPVHGRIKVLNNPIKLSETPAGTQCRAPELGEHTNELLAKLGYDPGDIQRMKEAGIIG
ncbi:MAG: CoA transferase [Proteobacteria bacterium]|nr:CoA transferase [Pseudomonadota bacterium]MBU2226069.1 CoA transferase [Pseudomonadota bacterium]MBU2260560.1 CoA transferase [Pseudomonadota bacterium]